MSNPDKPFVPQHAVPAGVVATRWWWVRHAPVREDGGCIYGQKDIGCDTSDRVVFEAVGKILPRNAIWYASHLKRTHQTASAIWAAGFPQPEHLRHERALAEQHLGEWQGLNRAAFFASRPIEVGSYWFAPIDDPAPGGESFMDLYIACAVRSRGSMPNTPARTSSRWRMVGRSRRRSGSRSAISRSVGSRSRSTIAQ
jgi:alpha-ribazole phosphatase